MISDGCFGLVAFVSILASLVGLWSAWRRRQITKRLLKSLEEQDVDLSSLNDPKP